MPAPRDDVTSAERAATKAAREAERATAQAVGQAGRGTAKAAGQAGRGTGTAASPAGARRAPLALAATVTTCWAALVSVAPVIAVVALVHVADTAGAHADQVLRVGVAGWLLAHGVPLTTGVGSIGLAPLGFTALAAWRVFRAGVHTARAVGGRRRRSLRLAVLASLGVAAVYALIGVAAARFASGPGLSISVPRAALTMGVFSLSAALAGAVRESGLYSPLVRRTPTAIREGVRTGVVAALLVLGAGAAVGGTAIAVAGGEAAQVLSAYHTGVAGQAGLTLLCLVYAPNLAVWAASYLVGPGFAVGAGTTVSAARVSLAALPAVPALAGLPSRAANGWGALLLGLPLAAGMAAGWLLARRLSIAVPAPLAASAPLTESAAGRPAGSGIGSPPAEAVRAAQGWLGLLGAAIIAGPVAGGMLALAAVASSGSLGDGRLAMMGPEAAPLAAVGAGLVATGAGVAALATRALIGVRRKER